MVEKRQLPHRNDLARSVQMIHDAGRFSNKNLGNKIGVSDASISGYRNPNATVFPKVDDIYALFEVIEKAPEIPNESRDNLRANLAEAVGLFLDANGTDALERDAAMRKLLRIRVTTLPRSSETRGRMARSKIVLPAADTPEAQLIEALLRSGSFSSGRDLGRAVGASPQAINAWRIGRHAMRQKYKERLLELGKKLPRL